MDQNNQSSIGFKSFELYNELRHRKVADQELGLKTGDFINITQLNNRLRLAQSFKGLLLAGYSKETVIGYNAFFKVFLTHSVLENFEQVMGFTNEGLCSLLHEYEPENILEQLKSSDPNGHFIDFLYSHSESKKVKSRLSELRNGHNADIYFISAAIRHIFAHGILTAHAHGINPKAINKFCESLSEFLISFMDKEFSKKIESFDQNRATGEN